MNATIQAGPDDTDEDGRGGPVDVVIEDARWATADLSALAHRAVGAALARLGLDHDAHACVVLGADDARIAALNAQFRGKTAATNVLSWPAQDLGAGDDGGTPARPRPDPFGDAIELGDIALAWETCAAEAAASGRSLADHVSHLTVHGLLHLLGYDHTRPRDAHRMETLEVEILATMGIANPYESHMTDSP